MATARERDAGFAASFGDGDIGNTNVVANLTMGVCHTFSNSSATVKLTNVYMQSVTFAHREF